MNADQNGDLPGATEVRAALLDLVQRHGAYCNADELLVLLSISRTAPALYVVMALNEAERLIANELETLTHRTSSGPGLWVLRPEEVSELIRKSAPNDSQSAP